ncbi:DNA-binding SARP family transcriptional activator [Catenulispora sp. EB89]|uniref:AfsR/SARP family transcriptional regulator n=1 Tax=Catenulispora sp. EB89 TaxID=3156257 RepID=UPI00351930AB
MGAPDLDIWILGPLRIRLDGRESTLRGTRVCRLAALLSVNADAVVPYERIVDVLWDDPPESARQQVHNVVGTLRRALGGGLVATEGAGYRLAVPQSAVDAYRFQAATAEARQALAEGHDEQALSTLNKGLTLWRGPALTGLRDSRLANAAAVLDEQRLDAVEAATAIRLRLGEAAATLGELTALVDEHPFRESLRALLMRALHASGRQADALTVYEQGRRMLADELGLDPGPQLRRAHEGVLRGDAAAPGEPAEGEPRELVTVGRARPAPETLQQPAPGRKAHGAPEPLPAGAAPDERQQPDAEQQPYGAGSLPAAALDGQPWPGSEQQPPAARPQPSPEQQPYGAGSLPAAALDGQPWPGSEQQPSGPGPLPAPAPVSAPPAAIAPDLRPWPGPEQRRSPVPSPLALADPTWPAHDPLVRAVEALPLPVPPTATPVPAPRVDRSFLPRDLAEFIGRERQIQDLVAQARAGGPAPQVAVIDGMGGVGKSTLAVHVAHRLAPLFPDGHYFVDLSGFCAVTEPVEPAQALEALLRASGLAPETLPEGLDERSALWRARLSGRRALVLLDNARDAAQIRPLLPGSGETFVLITSRRRMPSLEGAVPIPLQVMNPGSAIALFSRIIGTDRARAEPEAVASAVELCGRLPLAIQVAAARLRDRATWPVERVTEQLAGHRTRFLVAGDRDVTAILAWSYHQLLPLPKRLFRLLSLHPGPDFDAHSAAALAGAPLPDAESALECLFEANLLQERAPGRYHLHDLVHDVAAELQSADGEPDETLHASERLIDYYLHTATQWCAILETGQAQAPSQDPYTKRAKNPEHAERLLETELGNLVAVRRLAMALGWRERADELARVLSPHFGPV